MHYLCDFQVVAKGLRENRQIEEEMQWYKTCALSMEIDVLDGCKSIKKYWTTFP